MTTMRAAGQPPHRETGRPRRPHRTRRWRPTPPAAPTQPARTDTTGATDTTGGDGTDGRPRSRISSRSSTALPTAATPRILGGQGFKEIRALDELTVEFELCRPDVAFEGKIAFSAFGIHPQEVLEQTEGGGAALFENPIGTGPYKLEQWDRGNQIVMTRNDEYWGEPAFAETLVFRWSEEAAQRLVELQSGSVDGIDNPGKDDFEVIANDANLQLQEREGANIFYLGMNNAFPPFDNEQVRQALAIGIDRQRIVDNFYPQGSAVADQFLPPTIFGFTPEPTWPEYNPEEARRLLDRSRIPRRLRRHAQLPRRGAWLPARAVGRGDRHPGPARRHRDHGDRRADGVDRLHRRQQRR